MKRIIPFFLFLQACTMYPTYERPDEIAIPTEWRISTEELNELSNQFWWKDFCDEVLNNYIQEALLNNQDLMVAIHRVDEFAAKLKISESLLYPQINATGDGGRGKISGTQQPIEPSELLTFNSYSLLLNGSYYFDFWGQVRSGVDVALAELCAQVETRRNVVLTLITSVATTYIDILKLDRQIFIAKETLETRQQSYNLAYIRFELGLTSEMQVQQALSEVEDAAVRLYDLQILLAFAEDLFSTLLGHPPTSIQRGKLLDNLQMPLEIPVALPSNLLNQRPDILAAEQRLIAANANIGIAKANFFPQLSLTGTLGTESSELSQFLKSNSSVWDFGLTLLQEIFTGGELTYALKLAEAQKQTLLHEYQSTILKAFQEVNNALISHQIALKQLALQKDRVQTLQEYLHLSNLRYQEGLTDYLTFLDAERQFFAAQLDYASAQGYSFTTLIDIYRSLGGGWVINADSE